MRKLIFLLFLMTMAVAGVEAADVVFRASAPRTVAMGDQFRLTYTVNSEASDLRVPELSSSFDVLMGPTTSTSFSQSIINGRSSSETSTTFTFILMPKKEGTFNIPPATVRAKGANYTSNALAIRVIPADKASNSSRAQAQQQDDFSDNGSSASAASVAKNGVFLRVSVTPRSVYEQQGVLVTFKLYTRYDISSVNPPKFPEYDGFLAQEIEINNPQWVLERYNGMNYNAAVIKQTVLYPQRSGPITIKGSKMDVTIRVRAQRKKVTSIFDDFFDTYQDVNKVLTTPPVTVNVRPLPSGKPAGFSGTVGSFTMSSSINSNNVKTNDAVTIRLKISGNGNLKLIKNPEVTFPNDFEVYDPKVTNDIHTSTSGVSGSKTIEYMAIPRYKGDFEIPAIRFSYFDTSSGSYKTLTAGPYKLHVAQGSGNSSNASISNFSDKENLKFLGKDIRYLKIDNIHFMETKDMFFSSSLYWICYLIPAILFIIFFIVYRKQVKENANIALVRTKKANKIAVRRLKNASKLMRENKKEAFYDEVLRALWGYLSDKLSIPQANLTKDNVEAELSKYGVDENLSKEFMDVLNTCEFARFAPTQASDDLGQLYDLTVDAIGKMENTIKK